MSQFTELDNIVPSLYEAQTAEAGGATQTDTRNAYIDVIARINRYLPEAQKCSDDAEVVALVVNGLQEAVEKLVELTKEPYDSRRRTDLFSKAVDRVETASELAGRRFLE